MRLLVPALIVALPGCGEGAPAPADPPAPPAAAGAPAAGPGGGPNIVLVLVDTLRADHLGVYGYDRPTSPRLDAFAAGGTTWTRAYAQSGWTLASVTSLLSGQYPHQHGVVRDSRQPDRFGCLVPAVETLPEALRGAGYATAGFINNTFLAPEFGLKQGFDLYDYKGATNVEHRSADQTVDDALTWWDAQGDRPRFALVHFMEPHLNYEAPADIRGMFAEGPGPDQLAMVPGKADPFVQMQFGELIPSEESKRYTVARYDEEVRTADRAFGRLLDGLQARGQLDGTLVVLTADHGEEFWDHGRFEHGHALWSELTRVPLVAAGPGVSTGRVDTVVEHVDLFQGLVEKAHATRPAASAGEDLFSVTGTDRLALMENCLYGEPCISVVSQTHRLTFNPLKKYGGVLPILPDGSDGPQVQGPEQGQLGQPLIDALTRRRGGLEPVLAVGGGPRVPSYETFELLSQLGYVDRPDQPAATEPGVPAATPDPCDG